MKKRYFIIFIILLFLSTCMLIGSLIFRDKSIKIIDEMLEEETDMESAWDFKQNLNIGWNLGMSLSANINYPNIIQYRVLVNNYESELLSLNNIHEISLNTYINNKPLIEFDIPYSTLDGILYWTIETLAFDNKTAISNKTFASNVEKGKVSVLLDNIDISFYKNIEINISVEKFYEFDTLEKVNFYELFWGKTITTKELLKTLKDKGFNAIRISFDVYNHLDNNDIIDELWLNRLVEIVDYCMELDMYCLVDIIETYGLYSDDLNDESIQRFISLWTQVATTFKEYDHKLIFSPFNEIRNHQGDWNTDEKTILDNMNKLYQIFVDTIRNTGGKNRYRNLMLTTYAGGVNELILESIKVPNDVSYNHLLFECHCYVPVRFTFNETNLGSTDFRYEWGSLKDKDELHKIFKVINKFINKTKMPFIIGEFGVVDRNSVNERIEYLRHYKKLANKYKVGLFIFDDAHDFAIINRKTYEFYEEEIVNVLVN